MFRRRRNAHRRHRVGVVGKRVRCGRNGALELETALGAGGTGKGAAGAFRGAAGAMKDLERRQKSRATRLKRDALDRALVDLAGFYRDVLALGSARGYRPFTSMPEPMLWPRRTSGPPRARFAGWRPYSRAGTRSRRTSSRRSLSRR